jgi:hypothetical protein
VYISCYHTKTMSSKKISQSSKMPNPKSLRSIGGTCGASKRRARIWMALWLPGRWSANWIWPRELGARRVCPCWRPRCQPQVTRRPAAIWFLHSRWPQHDRCRLDMGDTHTWICERFDFFFMCATAEGI